MLYIASDHAGFTLKEKLKASLAEWGEDVFDFAPSTLNPTDDYPDYAATLAKRVSEETGARGILLCGNAEGVCIVANKFDGVRAGIGYSIEAAKTMRADDDTNILCLPGRLPTQDDPLVILRTWLDTPFSNTERHVRRLKKVADIERQ